MTRQSFADMDCGVAQAARLSARVDVDILLRRPVAGDGRAVEYKLTPKGLEWHPLIVFLHQWGDRWMPKPRGKRLEVVYRQTLRPVREVQVHDADGQPLTARDTLSRIGRGGSDVMRQLQSVVAMRQRGLS